MSLVHSRKEFSNLLLEIQRQHRVLLLYIKMFYYCIEASNSRSSSIMKSIFRMILIVKLKNHFPASLSVNKGWVHIETNFEKNLLITKKSLFILSTIAKTNLCVQSFFYADSWVNFRTARYRKLSVLFPKMFLKLFVQFHQRLQWNTFIWPHHNSAMRNKKKLIRKRYSIVF